MHKAAHSGSQEAAVNRAAVRQLQSCGLHDSIMLHRLEQRTSSTQATSTWSHVSGGLTGRRLCVQCRIAPRLDTALQKGTRVAYHIQQDIALLAYPHRSAAAQSHKVLHELCHCKYQFTAGLA